jgi:uncharacterized protein (DUF488 family)
MKLYSIGYGITRTPQTLIQELRKRGIQTLVDCRSHPFSRYNPPFSRNALQSALENAGITYIHDRDLGGKQVFAQNYKDAVKTLADQYGKKRPNTALMCSELDPRSCHRYTKIGEDLAKMGIAITHIDKDNSDWKHTLTAKKEPKKMLF